MSANFYVKNSKKYTITKWEKHFQCKAHTQTI